MVSRRLSRTAVWAVKNDPVKSYGFRLNMLNHISVLLMCSTGF